MYLKSIEMHGFKSFAAKIVLDFHQGITGIVGPNGSGKSNVADAVRWVLGEQSARQLRGASMQDVIFAGTESRKPVSYACVAITLDNADHALPVDYGEVTVTRRVYRSGESEYLLNGSICRLKDVYEIFYDTGIGQEGYSIIGQGQIEQILSGKPEERRELFDEAAGIVKFKRRKAAAQKKLEHERENMVRILDILSELERQTAPLEQQAQKARDYLKKKEELKAQEVRLFLMDMQSNEMQQKELEEKSRTADSQQKETESQLEEVRREYEILEQDTERLEGEITQAREEMKQKAVQKGRLEGQINVLLEQIRTAQMSMEHYRKRTGAIAEDKEKYLDSRREYEEKQADLDVRLVEIADRQGRTERRLEEIRGYIAQCNETLEDGKNRIIGLLNDKGAVTGEQQRLDMMLEQSKIRRAQLNQRRIQSRTEEIDLEAAAKEYENDLRSAKAQIVRLDAKEQEYAEMQQEWKQKIDAAAQDMERATAEFHKVQSRLEAMRNIAERYDGYGNSIRRVMEQKKKEPGIHGVVADLIKVEKRYETAIETALGGSIQHIVTDHEATAKKMVNFLKEHKYGRATFLPLTSVTGRGRNRNERALDCEGVIGTADTLVQAEPVYKGIMSYLLGRVIVVDQIDHAVALARNFHYSLHIVTLEGEQLSPGGSISGGAFRNSSNLLGRRREMEDLKARLAQLTDRRGSLQEHMQEIHDAQELLREKQEQAKAEKQAAYVEQNTAEMNLLRVRGQKEESEKTIAGLKAEQAELERALEQTALNREEIAAQLALMQQQEQDIEKKTAAAQADLEQQTALEQQVFAELSKIQLEAAGFGQQAGFAKENLERIDGELKKLEEELCQIHDSAKEAGDAAAAKEQEIETLRQEAAQSEDSSVRMEQDLERRLGQKEQMTAKQKRFFKIREELSERQAALDREIFRLNSQKEKLEEAKEAQADYMWTEYGLTPHHALTFQMAEYKDGADAAKLRIQIQQAKEEIRALGNVNVNAIEEYREVFGRFQFLKRQHDDLMEAEKRLVSIIEELDSGMRTQFSENFAKIQKEFNKAFQELFGGGKGTLELAQQEDILESGIRIAAHPPGKKLQNMMQLSGGEKALTAIALLFAIQNLKPSPFCLLDEIEAALDDSNVVRFAKYLHKLAQNTQFIVITHRRGTMASADRLYGITMQEKGVSALVSVSLVENELQE